MKFRVKTNDVGCMQYFSKVVSTMSHLAKNCILRLTKDRMYFIITERAVSGGVSIWCQLNNPTFFNEYALDGLDDENDEILMEVVLEQVMRCMRLTPTSRSLKLKLVKKATPCLAIEIEQPTTTVNSRLVVHNIPVKIVPLRMWPDFQRQPDPEFDVSLYLPPLRVVKNVVDKMKNLSNLITISAKQSGELQFKVKTDLVSVSTFFSDLSRPVWRQEQPLSGTTAVTGSTFAPSGNDATEVYESGRPLDESVSATLDIKRLNQLLVGQKFTPTKIVCNIVDQRVVQFFVLHDDVQLQYVIPVVNC